MSWKKNGSLAAFRWLLLGGLLSQAAWTYGQIDDPIEPMDRDVYVVLEGTIGDGLEVRMMLSRHRSSDDGSVYFSGTYQYRSQQKPILLWGTLKEDRLELSESPENAFADDEETITGHFDGKWGYSADDSTIPVTYEGTWLTPDGKRKLPFSLLERYADGIASADFYRFAVRYERERREGATMSREAEVIFPQFRGESDAINRINAFVRHLAADIDNMSESSMEDKSVEDDEVAVSGKDWFDPTTAPTLYEIERSVQVGPGEDEDYYNGFSNQWYFSDWFEIVHNEGNLVTLRISHDEYTGGAHGNQWDQHFTLDLKAGKEVVIDDLFKPGWEEPLTRLVEQELRKLAGMTSDEPIKEGPFFLDEFALNGNWYLTGDGIGFSYVPYEIAAYAFGFVRIEVPREKLTDLISEDSPLNRAISR